MVKQKPILCHIMARIWKKSILLLIAVLMGCSNNSEVTPEASLRESEELYFPLPQKIVVSVYPYQSVEDAINEQSKIDWYRESDKANAITLAYAAKELQTHLEMVGVPEEILISEMPASVPAIVLVTADNVSRIPIQPDFSTLGTQGFTIIPYEGSIYIFANDRIGILYGCYRLLQEMGFAWHDPYETLLPDDLISTPRLWTTINETPTIELRGFFTWGSVSDEFAVWLARNRFNIAGGITPSLAHMLGIKLWAGDETLLQEEFSREGLFEAHPEWFAFVNGSRRPVSSSGTYYNPCFANSDAANYFAERMIERLTNGDLMDVDILNIWPSDSRSNSYWDKSPEAQAIGNETDNLLHFYTVVSNRFRTAYESGVLSRPVIIGGISYYVTWKSPTNMSVLAALNNNPDYLHIFYLNERDWSDVLDQNLENRDTNHGVVGSIEEWHKKATFRLGFVEFYNYSAYSAIGLSDMHFLAKNYDYLETSGPTLFAYMHPILKNPGPFRMTNLLLAQLPWRSQDTVSIVTKSEAILNDFFKIRYGALSEQWKLIQRMMAESVQNAKEMYGHNSLAWVVLQNIYWTNPLYTTEEAIQFIPQYRLGGTQDLPALNSGLTVDRETFLGLDASLQLQESVVQMCGLLKTEDQPEAIKARLEEDILWIEATCSRYRLLAAACDYLMAKQAAIDTADIKSRMLSEIEILSVSPVTNDTVSPVDQRSFLQYYQSLINQ